MVIGKKFGYAATAVFAVALLGAASAKAALITYDFESETATSGVGSYPGALSSLAILKSGLTMTITRPSSSFDIFSDTGSLFPSSWGDKRLAPFAAETSATPFVLDFSAAISSFSVEWGDFNADTPDVIKIEAFSGLGATGSLLGMAGASLPDGPFTSLTTALAPGSPIRSIRMIAGTSIFPNSVYYDNIIVRTSSIPEPATLAMLGIGLLGLGALRRRSMKSVE